MAKEKAERLIGIKGYTAQIFLNAFCQILKLLSTIMDFWMWNKHFACRKQTLRLVRSFIICMTLLELIF